MKRLLVIALAGIAVALGTAGTAQAGDRHCYSSRSHYSHGYSSGYCAPRTYYRSYNYCPPTTYYRSYNYCPPTTYYRSYNSYNCQPRYYSPPCYRSGGISISVPGFGIFFRR
jgi:hypothetical protein